jgi:hypothetical protein
MFKSSRFHVVFVTCLMLVFSFEAIAQTAAVVVKENTLITYKQSPNSKIEIGLICVKEVEKVCQEFQVVKKTIYKIGDDSRIEQDILTDVLTREEMESRFKKTFAKEIFEQENPAAGAAGMVFLPLPLIVLSLMYPPLWPIVPMVGLLSLGALAILPVALVATVIIQSSSAVKIARWSKVAKDAMAGKVIKRPFRIRNAIIYNGLVQFLTTQTEL